VLERNSFQAAVEMIGPAVIAALKFVSPPLIERDHHGAAVGALVVQDMELFVGTADDDDRLAPDLRAKIIARLAHLAFVADIDPGPAENALELKLEDRRIVVKRTMHRSRFHQ
jgi:hypothetical protein